MGLMINGIDWSKRISPMNPMPELERNLYYALQAVGSGSSNPIAQHTITQAAGGALNPICAGMPEFAELVQKAQEIFENFQVTEAPESLELHNKLTNVLYKTLITKVSYSYFLWSFQKTLFLSLAGVHWEGSQCCRLPW